MQPLPQKMQLKSYKEQIEDLRTEWTETLASFDEHSSELMWQRDLEASEHWLISLPFGSVYWGQWSIVWETS